MRRRTPEERYADNTRKQLRILQDFAEQEIEWSKDLMLWYRTKKKEMPDDEYRACAFFQNREFQKKPGSLTLMYQTNNRCNAELPAVCRENAFDILRFKFKMFAKVLENGGY